MQGERDSFVNSLLGDLEIQDPTGKTVPMHYTSDTVPNEVKNEQPWHRTLAYLMLQGKSNIACAKELNKSPATVSLVKRQDWFRNILTELSKDSFENDFMALLEGSAMSAVLTLDDLQHNSDDERIKASAASKLADMYVRNRPPQKEAKIEDPVEELRQLEEKQLMLEEEAALGGKQDNKE